MGDRAQQAILHGGPSGGECRCQGVLRVQGRGEGSPLSSAPKAEAEELPGQHPRRDMGMHMFFLIRTFLSSSKDLDSCGFNSCAIPAHRSSPCPGMDRARSSECTVDVGENK